MQPAFIATSARNLFAVAVDADASAAFRLSECAGAAAVVVAAAVGSKNALIGTSPGASSSG